MVINKRKKNVRQRGSHTHGWGSKKKHRGAGNRGGRGNAGSGKRGDSTKPRIWKNKRYFGSYGFQNKRKEIKAVNISQIEIQLDSLVSRKLAVLDNGTYLIDLKKIGYDKLLGSGKVTKKLRITAGSASKKAVQAVEKAKGAVIMPEAKE